MRVGAEGVVALEVAHDAVVRVDVGARRHVLGGKADDLAVTMDRFTGCDWFHRNLVSGGNALGDSNALRSRARLKRRPRDHNAVAGM